MSTDTIVDFERPPVVETVIGLQFDRIRGLQNAHLGAFWKSLGNDWPTVRDAPPLVQEHEKFGENARLSKGFQIEVSEEHVSRLMIWNQIKDRLIQVQNGRLHLNWLKVGDADYPRYPRIFADFSHVWAQFSLFLKVELNVTPKLNQWEVTYVNLIPRGTVWDNSTELSKAFSFVGTDVTGGCGPLEDFSSRLRFEIQPARGRLHVEFAQVRNELGTTVGQLTLTARGPINWDVSNPIEVGLGLGREAIVRAFAALTTPEARKHWKERHVDPSE